MKLLAAKPLLCVVAELVFADVSILSEPAAIDAVAEPNNTVVAITIIVLVTKHIRENVDTVTPENSKSAIIYTPINYDINNSEQQQSTVSSNTNNTKTTDDINSTASHIDTTKASQLTAATATNAPTIDTSAVASKTLVAHPPTTANINNVVIDDQTAARQQSE